MSTEIYYFSGTGNSLHVARELQKRLPESALIPILSLAGNAPVTPRAARVGFVFPHYASTLPKVVRAFVERLDLGAAGYLFAIATRGGTETMAFVEMDGILKRQGKRLDSFFAITMPGGSEPLVKGYADRINEERIDRLEAGMLARLDAIQRIVAHQEVSREQDAVETPPFLVPLRPLIRAAAPLLIGLGKRVESTFDFYCDDRCTGCGTCEQVCLAGKVRLVDGRPVWQPETGCYGCFACLNYCPRKAVQVRSRWFLKSYTTENGRYHHPAITAQDIAAQKRT